MPVALVLALTLAVLTLAAACVPTPVGRTSPGPATPTPVPTATPVPSPTGPTPVPSFVRPTPTPIPTFALYTVVAGDTLSSIAQRYGTTARSLAYWNRAAHASLDPESEGYAPDRIAIGWVLQLIPNTVIDEEEVDGSPSTAPSSLPTVAPPAAGTLPPVGAASVVVSHGDRSSRKVALTFDMGGRLDPALDILGYLIDSDVRATIFPTGLTGTTTDEGMAVLELVAEHRDAFVLGNHSWSHPDFRELDDEAMRDQLDRTEAGILELINVSTKPYFRPPYGALDDQIPATVGAAGWGYTVLWDVDTIDWKLEADGGPTTQQIVDTVLAKAQGGSIVLMHLGGYHTLDALPGILSGLEAKGLAPVTLDELLTAG
jgi:peptidoglycan/xylan/chitin deacetylase (PgdA/CDA1 family)